MDNMRTGTWRGVCRERTGGHGDVLGASVELTRGGGGHRLRASEVDAAQVALVGGEDDVELGREEQKDG